MTNPLLTLFYSNANTFPEFKNITANHVMPALKEALQYSQQQIEKILTQDASWLGLVEPLERVRERLNKMWSPVSHLQAVYNTSELRQAYNDGLPLLSEFWSALEQNESLYYAFLQLSKSKEYQTLNLNQQKVVDNALRDFKLAGVSLASHDKTRYRQIKQRLTQLSSKFSENVLDATQAWSYEVTSEQELQGIPESTKQLTKLAKQATGWRLTLDFPTYFSVMRFADNRALRKIMYHAYVTRASDQSVNKQWDNSLIMTEILALRHELAVLLEFENYAELSLATKMATSPQQVHDFLQDLANHALPHARSEIKALQDYAQTEQVEDLQAWDILYYSEKLRHQDHNLSEDEIRPYFEVYQVLAGLFKVLERLFGLQINAKAGVQVWHDDVQFFEIYKAGQLRGGFFVDLFARPEKRGGAWMGTGLDRVQSAIELQNPVAYIVCNFAPPMDGQPSLLSHREVETLFHEFGHGLQHLLTQVAYPSIAGINGIAWDAVELPSQMMENWCWQKQALDLFAEHYVSKQPLPDDLYQKMWAAKTFQTGMQTVRQIEFAMFDLNIHWQYQAQPNFISERLQQVRALVSVYDVPDDNRFAHSFSHIFAGGYAAGYYSYKWAEVLSADAFSKFEVAGIFDQAIGQAFVQNILETGGSQDAMDLFIAFRGREPNNEALFKQCGWGMGK